MCFYCVTVAYLSHHRVHDCILWHFVCILPRLRSGILRWPCACMPIRLVCPRAYFWSHWFELHRSLELFSLWFRPPLVALRDVISVLWISSCLHIIAKNRRHDKRTSNWHTRIKHMTRSRVWYYRERKCADTIGTVPVPLAGHFRC